MRIKKTSQYIEGGLSISDIYPIGSIYISVNNVNPSTLFGGTWEQIKDTFLLSAGDTYTAGATGGEATHTLTVDEMPSHNHAISGKVARSEAATGSNYNGDTQRFLTGRNHFANSTVSSTDSSAALIKASDLNGVTMLSIASKGGGQEHNNMPPYLAVYMWKRTA